MPTIRTIHACLTTSMSDLRRRLGSILAEAANEPVAVLQHDRPAAYLLSARAYESLLERLDDTELIRIVKQRQVGKRVLVKLEDL